MGRHHSPDDSNKPHLPKEQQGFIFYRANGRALAAIEEHQRQIEAAQSNIQAFVMLCGAERAFGGGLSGLTGLHFTSTIPAGWVKNAHAPHMAIPDTDTQRGRDFETHMKALRLPSQLDFAALLLDKLPQDTALAPAYLPDPTGTGWLIRCPIGRDGQHIEIMDSEKLDTSPSLSPSQLWPSLSGELISISRFKRTQNHNFN
jgi:hypothetical protein